MAKIIYIGQDDPSTSSAQRAAALIRLGHLVFHFNPYKVIDSLFGSNFFSFLHYRSGYRLIQSQMSIWVARTIVPIPNADLIWIDSGELFGISPLKELKKQGCPIILYNLDDPTGKRDNTRFYSLKKAIPYYDRIIVVRKETEKEIKILNPTAVMRVFRSYDELAHKPLPSDSAAIIDFASEVSFIGTWIPSENRDDFVIDLLKRNIPLSIWGNNWHKSPNWNHIKSHHKGEPLSGERYVAAIQGAKICLGLLSKGNRDLHTQRSLEIPYSGGLLCGERTPEHEELYTDGEEAVFWKDANECADICHHLLTNHKMRESIRTAGMKKVRSLGVGNEDVCRKILDSFKRQF